MSENWVKRAYRHSQVNFLKNVKQSRFIGRLSNTFNTALVWTFIQKERTLRNFNQNQFKIVLIYVPSLFTNIQLFKENIITKNVLKRIGLFSNPLVKSKWSEYDRNKYIYLVFVTSIPLHTKLDHLFTINLASLSKFEQVLTQIQRIHLQTPPTIMHSPMKKRLVTD